MTMMKHILLSTFLLGSAAAAQPASPPDPAAGPWDPPSRIEAERKAMEKLAFLDGAWRGEAQTDTRKILHTERAGSLLGGSIRLIEGHSYENEGKTGFNALGIISYDPVKHSYSMHSYAMGFASDFPLEVRPDGYSWTLPQGPGGPVRYTATVKNGEWVEIGERIAGGAKVFEMRLRRIGPGGWPAEGAVPPR
ncbi:MAG: hypothetical protein QOG72_239 [Sphingomonadales bacterium]|jgi:hypothetical protein|nr:hypothetical protein [Sphingomonadales bacterium]